MIIEEKLAEQARDQLKNAAKTLTDIQMAILRKLIEKQKLRQLTTEGELPLEQLMKTLNKKDGENLSYCALSSDVYQDMRATGLLESCGLKCFSALASNTNDQVLLFYGSEDQKYVDKVLHIMDTYYGNKSELTKDEFFIAAKEKEIAVFKGLSDEDLMLLSNITKDPGDGNFPNSLPYSVIEMGNEKYLVCMADDLHAMNNNLDLVAGVYTSEQGPKVLEDIREQIKGRQARNITVDEAKKYNAIIDKDAPKNRLIVTADDFEFYKNNKEITKIPISDKQQLSRVYDLIDGMSDPVLIKNINKFETLSVAEQKEFMDNSATPVQRESDRAIDVNMTQAREQLKDTDEITKYLSKVSAIVVAADSSKDLEKTIRQYEKQQAEQEREDHTDSPEQGGRRHTPDFDAR